MEAPAKIDPGQLAAQMLTVFSEHIQSDHRWMLQSLRSVSAAFSAVDPIQISEADANALLLQVKIDGPPSSPGLYRDCCALLSRSIEIDGHDWTPLGDETVFRQVIDAFNERPLTRAWRMRAARGLLHAYLSTDIPLQPSPSPTALLNWQELGAIISSFAVENTDRRFGRLLAENAQLMRPNAASYYAEASRADPSLDVEVMARTVGIPETGWFWPALIRAEIELLKSAPRNVFESEWPNLLNRTLEHEIVIDRCLAQIMEIFASHKPAKRKDAQPLIDLAVDRWKHPLSPRSAWHAHVSEETLNVFRPWVSEQLIETFFRFLATDQNTDQTRPHFWKQYAPLITDIYIIYGARINTHAKKELDKLRTSMGNRVRMLNDSPHVFAMRIGDYYFCEISEHGNALFCHNLEFMEQLTRPGRISLKKVKTPYSLPKSAYEPKTPSNRWIHGNDWQIRFAQRIFNLTGYSKPKPNYA